MLPAGSSSPFFVNMFQPDAAPAQSSAKGKAPTRRQSRFDPMMREDESEIDEEVYGDLGQRHPLRRVKEEPKHLIRPNPPEHISLPGIKSLFGVAGVDHPLTPPTSSMFPSPSLPALIPGSPSASTSPGSARTSRYSSLASSTVPENSAGWWLPDFDGLSSTPPSMYSRSGSYPTNPSQTYIPDEHDAKRRRSDGPPSFRDSDESSRLRWTAQNRNASYPMESLGLHTPHTSAHPPQGLRGMLHPPQASSAAMSAAMSRGSISGSTAGGTLSPTAEHAPRPLVPSRNPSLVGGQLSRHFADLSTTSAPSSSASDMPPPLSTIPQNDRRPSSFFPPISAIEDSNLLAPPSASASSSRLTSRSPDHDRLRRPSSTRPTTPESQDRPTPRRSSLTEIIMAKSGDNFAMPTVQLASTSRIGSTAMEKPSVSEPVHPIISGWPGNHQSIDLTRSDSETTIPSSRSRKRSADGGNGADEASAKSDPAMRGMEVLAESATRAAAELEETSGRKESEEDRDTSPSRSLNAGAQPGPKYTCAYCAKTFSRPSSLRIHTYSHTGERPYVCKEPSCRRRFSVQSNLKRHAKVHQLAAAGQVEGLHSLPHHQPLGMRGPPQHVHGQPTFHPPPAPYPYPPAPSPAAVYTHGHGPHGMSLPHPHPDGHGHFGMPPGPNISSHGVAGAGGHHLFPPPLSKGEYRSASSSRRTSRDEGWSEREGDADGDEEDEGEEEGEEVDELDEDN